MPSSDRLDVFLSSAQEEFKNERKALSRRISGMPFLDCMPLEERGADTVSVEEASIEGAKECDIYVGIFGSRYSELATKEYHEAIKHRKLCLNYVKRTPKRDPKLQDFIERELKGQFKYHEFRSRTDLYTRIEADLQRHLGRLLHMGIDQLKNSKDLALATQTELKPVLTKAIKEKEEDKPLSIMDEAEKSFAEADWMAATMKAAVAVELAARLALLRAQTPAKELERAPMGKVLNLLRDRGILEATETNQLQELVYLRNATIHEGKIPSKANTEWVLKLAEEFVKKLRK